MTIRNFIDTQDFSRQELLDMLEFIRCLKAADKQGITPKLLKGVSLGMIFEKASTRTRISFEVAMTKLGGHALYLKPGEIHLGERETLYDSGQVISRMVDIIMARTLKHQTLLGLAAGCTVPLINGLTDYNHPTQVICDIFTMMEHRPAGKRLEDVNVVFVGSATNVLNSLLLTCTKLGMKFTHAAPEGYQPPREWIDLARQNCLESGGSLTITSDPVAAVREADFIHTDLWWQIGHESEMEALRPIIQAYQVNMTLLKSAPASCKFMHCLPAARGHEVSDEVMDCSQSIIYDQSENRLHAEKGILVWFAYPRLKHPSAELWAYHTAQAESFLAEHLPV